MGWSLGEFEGRDIGYGVPAICDHPDCNAEIDRGLSYVCGSEPYGGENGCGLFFCEKHRSFAEDDTVDGMLCERCCEFFDKELTDFVPFDPKPDTQEWINHKMTHPSWAKWRTESGL
jgi:hypothetical protein